MIKLTKKKSVVFLDILEEYKKKHLLTEEQVTKLSSSIEIITFDWKKLAKYCFWFSVINLIIAASAIISDKYLIQFIIKIFGAHNSIKCLSFAFLSLLFFTFSTYRRKSLPEKIFSNESLGLLGTLTSSASLFFLGKALSLSIQHLPAFLLISSLAYSLLAIYLSSKLVWIYSLLILGSWMGAKTGDISGWGTHYLGMNYPLRFVLFGGILIALSYLFNQFKIKLEFVSSTKVVGLLYLFMALWILSIVGNYGDIYNWYKVKQIELFHWSLLFGCVSITSIFCALRFDDNILRGFGITFLMINFYTRYFEYFWDSLHKFFFFFILALSFWVIGLKAERLWILKK